MVHDSLERVVLTEVDRRFGDAWAFLRELVRQRSVLGQERGAQELVYAHLREIGSKAEMGDLDPARLGQYLLFGALEMTHSD